MSNLLQMHRLLTTFIESNKIWLIWHCSVKLIIDDCFGNSVVTTVLQSCLQSIFSPNDHSNSQSILLKSQKQNYTRFEKQLQTNAIEVVTYESFNSDCNWNFTVVSIVSSSCFFFTRIVRWTILETIHVVYS